jgi:hypothetical protein
MSHAPDLATRNQISGPFFRVNGHEYGSVLLTLELIVRQTPLQGNDALTKLVCPALHYVTGYLP